MEDRTSFILSMVLFVGAVVLGILNGTYVLRQDMFQHRGQRGYMTLYSQTVILVSYVSSLVGGYAYEKGDLYTYYASWHLSAPTLMLGSFLLILALHAFLPAVQLCMSYDVRWNTAAKGLTYAVFVFTTVGVLTTTIIIGYRQVQLRQTTGLEHLLSLRNIFFTMWAAYAPLLCATISILVIRMVIAVKQNLNLSFRLSPDQPENDTAALHAHALLQTIQRRAVVSTCLAIPVTLVVGCASLYPYSAILDGVMTIYTAVFCSWILHNIHLIRVIAQHTPRNLSMPALKTAAHPNGANNAFELHHSCQATKFAADPTSTTTTNTTTTSATCTTHHGRETESRERFLVLPGRSSRLSGEKVRAAGAVV